MNDVALFKKRFFSYDMKYVSVVADEKMLLVKTLYGKPEIGDLLYLALIQNMVSELDFSMKPVAVREADFFRMMKDYYYLRKLCNGTPVFAKRVFPEFVLNPDEHVVNIGPEDNAASIMRKVLDSLGCGVLPKDNKYPDDAKECNNRVTELQVWKDMKSTKNIIDEIFSDYVHIVPEMSTEIGEDDPLAV
jgi:hypothetical protein